MNASSSSVLVRGLTCGYTQPGFGSRRHTLIEGLDLTVPAGGVVALVGDNGSGKSTIIAGIVDSRRRFSGRVTTSDGTQLREGQIAFVPQNAAATLAPWRTVEEEIELWGRINGLPSRDRRRRTRALLDHLGISLPLDRRVDQLSGGQRVIVAVVRALLVQAPKLLVLDEPFEGLSARMRNRLVEIVRRVANDGLAVLLTSHRSEDLAAVEAQAYQLESVPVRSLQPMTLDGVLVPVDSQLINQRDGFLDALDLAPESAVGGRTLQRSARSALVATGGIALGICLWDALARTLDNPSLLPGPLAVAASILEVLSSRLHSLHLGATLARSLAGWGLALFLAVPIGVTAGFSRTFFQAIAPWLSLGRCVPLFALAGSAIGLFPAMPEVQRMFLIVMTLALIDLQIVSLGAAMSTRRRMDVARTMGAGLWFQMRILLRESMSSIIAAMETTMPISLIVTFVIEIILIPRLGAGSIVFNQMTGADLSLMFAYLLIPATVVASLMWLVRTVAHFSRHDM